MDIPNNQVVLDQPESIDPSQVEIDQHIPSDEVQIDQPKEQNTALSATEGAMRGLTGGLSDVVFKGARNLAESVTDNPELQDLIAPKTEDVSSRADTAAGKVAEAGAVGAGLLTGAGIPGFITKGAKSLIPEVAGIGSSILRGAVESMALQGGDEISKAVLGKGDPEEAVAPALVRMGGAGLLGGFSGGVFNGVGKAANKGLSTLENAKLGDRAEKVLAGLGLASKAHAAGVPFEEAEEFAKKYYQDFGASDVFNYADYKDGVKLYYKGLQKVTSAATRATTDAIGTGVGGIPGLIIADKLISPIAVPIVEKILQKPLLKANKYVMPAVLGAMSKGQTSGLFNVLNHTENIAKGAKAINTGVESLFKAGTQQSLNDLSSDKDINAIKDFIDQGGVTQEMQDSLKEAPQPGQEQHYAKGGEVKPQSSSGSLSSLYPEQAMLMSAAKGRMSNYLNSLKPQDNPQKLPYDKAPDQKDQHKAYNEAVGIAANPLKVLNHIKDGSLQLDHMKHLNSMYPELTQHLQKKITKRMLQSQLDDEQPKGRVKQAMALFLGAPLETYQTPQGIVAAQSVFAPKQTPQQAKTKKGTTNLGKSNKSYQTPEQAAENYKSNRK